MYTYGLLRLGAFSFGTPILASMSDAAAAGTSGCSSVVSFDLLAAGDVAFCGVCLLQDIVISDGTNGGTNVYQVARICH